MIFETLKDQPSSLPQKKLLETLYRGVTAEAAGWRHLFEGHGDEASIVASLGEVIDVLYQHSKNPRGPKKQCPTPADEQVIDRYLQREKFDLNMRHFVEQAIADGTLDRKVFTDVHVTRLERWIERGY
jgi:hypothetical protein